MGLLSSHSSHVLASHVLTSHSHVLVSRGCNGWWCSSASFSRDGRIRSLLGVVVVVPGLVDSISSVSSDEEDFDEQIAQDKEARGRYR